MWLAGWKSRNVYRFERFASLWMQLQFAALGKYLNAAAGVVGGGNATGGAVAAPDYAEACAEAAKVLPDIINANGTLVRYVASGAVLTVCTCSHCDGQTVPLPLKTKVPTSESPQPLASPVAMARRSAARRPRAIMRRTSRRSMPPPSTPASATPPARPRPPTAPRQPRASPPSSPRRRSSLAALQSASRRRMAGRCCCRSMGSPSTAPPRPCPCSSQSTGAIARLFQWSVA
jgi:hypothetical protein